MRDLINKKIIKQIVLTIVIIMLCNFIMPNFSYAAETEEGGSLMNWLGEFICFIPDAILEALQNYFVTIEGIQDENKNYKILYSPATIFAGEVPAFDINFISPGDDKTVIRYKTSERTLIEALNYNGAEFVEGMTYWTVADIWFPGKEDYIRELKEKYQYDKDNEVDIDELEGQLSTFSSEDRGTIFNLKSTEIMELNCAWSSEDNTVYLITEVFQYDTAEILWVDYYAVCYDTVRIYKISTLEDLENSTETAGTLQTAEDARKTYKSSAGILQKVVSTWYNALRKVALVGLLSVLVYLGIKIVLSSTSAKDKAKYKAMLKDWVAALCILFTLHYLMNVMIIVVNKVSDILAVSIIGENGEDILMSTVRNHIRVGDSWGEVLTYLVIYFVLMIYTIIFTIQYLRRVIYLAFLTMIAPLITLTYPLDKIKDKKAQAFDMWVKDYLFFSLLQVLHLVLYYVFLGSAMDLTEEGNWIFAIIAIGFMTKAEKIMKKMFGFEKSNSMGALAAGATGALAMDLINKISHGAPPKKGGSGGTAGETGGSSKGVRMATNDPLAALRTVSAVPTNGSAEVSGGSPEAQTQNGGGTQPQGGGSLPDTQMQAGGSGLPSAQGGAQPQNGNGSFNSQAGAQNTGAHQSGNSAFPTLNSRRKNGNRPMPSSNMPTINRPKRNILNGVRAVGGRYLLPAVGTLAGGVLEGTGAMIGLAAGISQGSITTALGGARAGARAGMNLGQGAVNIIPNAAKSIKNTVNEIEDTFNEGTHGEVYANNIRFDRAFMNSSDYRKLKREFKSSNKEFDKIIQQMLDAGIEDPKKMEKILKNHRKNSVKFSINKAIAYSELAEKCPEGILYDNNKFIRFCEDHNIEITEEQLSELRKCIIEFK